MYIAGRPLTRMFIARRRAVVPAGVHRPAQLRRYRGFPFSSYEEGNLWIHILKKAHMRSAQSQRFPRRQASSLNQIPSSSCAPAGKNNVSSGRPFSVVLSSRARSSSSSSSSSSAFLRFSSGRRYYDSVVTLLQGWLVEYCFTSTETVGLLRTGARPGRPRRLWSHTAPNLCLLQGCCCVA